MSEQSLPESCVRVLRYVDAVGLGSFSIVDIYPFAQSVLGGGDTTF